MKMMDGFPPNNQLRQEKISAIATATEEIKLAEKAAARNVEVAESKEVAYESCFGDDGFPEPMHAMENWEKDTEFARQFMSGANPVLLKVAKDPIRQLSKNMVKHFGEKKLQELADKKQLFFVSYDDLAELEVNPHQAYPLPMNKSSGPNGSQASQNEPRYTYAPIVTFVYDFSKDEMDILGIQLERTDDAPVYTKNTSGKNLWLFVKSQVANADSNMHQWVNHLGETHLTMEVRAQTNILFCSLYTQTISKLIGKSNLLYTMLHLQPHVIAIYNTLRKANHPLYTFLKPLCRDTLLINCKLSCFKTLFDVLFPQLSTQSCHHLTSHFLGTGRETLVSFEALAWGDYQSSVGVGQAMQLIGKMWSRYSFFEKTSLPDELASRGFTEDIKMPAYLYREDGMKLWNAIGDFAKDFVDEIYNSDQAVAADTHIQDWAKETTDADKGAIPGFPTSFEDKETVIKVLQTLMWLSSGLHAAVNFGFYDYYAYVPNKPLNVRADMSTIPKDDEQIREWMFEHMFPHVRSNDTWLRDSSRTGQDATIDIISMAQLLNLPSDHCLDNLSDEFATIGKEAYGTFLKRLNAISDGINARNEEAKKANKAMYNYLNPTVVPASIDI